MRRKLTLFGACLALVGTGCFLLEEPVDTGTWSRPAGSLAPTNDTLDWTTSVATTNHGIGVLDVRSLGDSDPEGMTLGVDGALYIAMGDSDQVHRYDPATQLMAAFTAPGMAADIQGLAFGKQNNLFVASRDEHAVVEFDGQTGVFLGVHATATVPNSIAFFDQ